MEKEQTKKIVSKAKLAASIVCPLIFAVFNGVYGVIYRSIWNQSICGYYVFLLVVRVALVACQNSNASPAKIKAAYVVSFVVLLLMNLALVAPAVLMITNQRVVKFGKIASIAVAAYTTYSIVMSILGVNKSKRGDLLGKQLALVTFFNAIVSVIILQNTLIVVNGGYDQSMTTLTIVTTFCLIAFLIFITVFSFVRNVKHFPEFQAESAAPTAE